MWGFCSQEHNYAVILYDMPLTPNHTSLLNRVTYDSFVIAQRTHRHTTQDTINALHKSARTNAHVQARAHTYTHAYSHTHTHTHAHTHTHTHARTHAHTHARTHTQARTHTHTHTHTHTRARARAHAHNDSKNNQTKKKRSGDSVWGEGSWWEVGMGGGGDGLLGEWG